MDNSNCKTQAHARVRKENKLELEFEEKMIPTEEFCGSRCQFEGPYTVGRVGDES